VFLGLWFEGVLLYKQWWDRLDPVPPPVWLSKTLLQWGLPADASAFLRGLGLWSAHTFETLPGLVLSFSQVMVLVGLAVALATRMPMVVNLTSVLVVYFASHLTPVLVSIGQAYRKNNPRSAVSQLVAFVADLLNTILPSLEFFRVGPVLTSDTPLPTGPFLQYVGSVTLYGVVYTLIVLLLGLILFEDRDLA
jgi:hypothetical protein